MPSPLVWSIPEEQGSIARRTGSFLAVGVLVLGIPLALIALQVTPPIERLGYIGSHPSTIAR
jgi:hypothetical protein